MIHPAACTCVDCCNARVSRIMSQSRGRSRRSATWYRHIPDKVGFGVTFTLVGIAYLLTLMLTIGMGIRGYKDALRKLAG